MKDWDKLKKLVHHRDKHICQSCGKFPSSQVHHIIPRRKDGKDKYNNLITLCTRCHMLVSPIPDSVLIKLFHINPKELDNEKNKVHRNISKFVSRQNYKA